MPGSFDFSFKGSLNKEASENIKKKMKTAREEDFISDTSTPFSKLNERLEGNKYDTVKDKNKDSEDMERFLRGLHGRADWKY